MGESTVWGNGGVFDGFLRRRGMGAASKTTILRWDDFVPKTDA